LRFIQRVEVGICACPLTGQPQCRNSNRVLLKDIHTWQISLATHIVLNPKKCPLAQRNRGAETSPRHRRLSSKLSGLKTQFGWRPVRTEFGNLPLSEGANRHACNVGHASAKVLISSRASLSLRRRQKNEKNAQAVKPGRHFARYGRICCFRGINSKEFNKLGDLPGNLSS
jgi:hypothetical protein